MPSVRLRRLKADYDRICTFFTGKSRIRVLKAAGRPPEKYQIEFLVPSLQKNMATREIHIHNGFIAEITLTGSYPRMAPQCRMLTPVFHPNIAPHAICIGDHWAAGESLPYLIARIGEMLVFQSYNVRSPLNGEAARWVEQNVEHLPLDDFDFASLLSIGEASGRNADGTLRGEVTCANCGREGDGSDMLTCVSNHVVCRQCIHECPQCEGVLCLKCNTYKCTMCGISVCHQCVTKCIACDRLACREHTGTCHVCGLSHCEDCLVECRACGEMACVQHVGKAELDGEDVLACTECLQNATQ